MNDDTFIFIYETLIYGFCFTSFLVYGLNLIRTNWIIENTKIFFNESIKIIRIIALLYLVYLFYYFLVDYNYALVEKRATGPYSWAYWIMVLRPVNTILLIQLFWFKKFRKRGYLNFILLLAIFLVLFFNGANLERYIIVVTSLHRDYGTPQFYKIDPFWHQLPFLVMAMFIERVFIYTLLVLTSLFISNRIKNL